MIPKEKYDEYIEVIKEDKEMFKSTIYDEIESEFVYEDGGSFTGLPSPLCIFLGEIAKTHKILKCPYCAFQKAITIRNQIKGLSNEHEHEMCMCIEVLRNPDREDKRLILMLYDKAIKLAERERDEISD